MICIRSAGNFPQFGQDGTAANLAQQQTSGQTLRQHQAGNQQHSSQYHQQGVRSRGISSGKQDIDLQSRRKNKKSSQKANPQGKRKRKTAQFDKRNQGGYSINVFNNAGKNYSIFDGNFNKNLEPIFGNNNNPERQHDAVNNVRQFKRNIGSQGLRTDNSNPWPNDKHWNNQQYESREFGEHIPFLF